MSRMALPRNRSIPTASIIPVLAYDDVPEAAAWLCEVFGFTERLRIASHRIQLLLGDGAVVVTERGGPTGATDDHTVHSILVRVPDANHHHAHAAQRGARITQPPTDYPFGERQYSAVDLGGHRWTFSQSIADADPASWGGVLLHDDTSH
jgi:uncharacterized glyoxalase superfamily protein PhnB